MSTDSTEWFSEINACFVEAEKALANARTKVSSVDGLQVEGLVFPAVNELRYAGKHLSEALLLGEGDAARIEQLRKARNHCHRATYDARDAVVQFFLAELRLLDKTFKESPIPIMTVYQSYPDDKAALRKIQNDLVEEQRDKEKRGEYAARKDRQINALEEIRSKWDCARDDVFRICEQRKEDAAKLVRQHSEAMIQATKANSIARNTLIVAILAVVVAIAALGVAVYQGHKGSPGTTPQTSTKQP